MSTTTHISDEFLEAFAMHRLRAEDTDQLEDHLLICGNCRRRLEEVEQDVKAIRIAAARIREEEFFRKSRRPWWQPVAAWSLRPGWALAGIGLLAVVLAVPLLREPSVVYRDVALQTMRGGTQDSVPTGANVRMRFQLALQGVEQLPQYQVAVVDSSGKTLYQSGPVTPETRTQLTVAIPRELSAGDHWVRLSTVDGGRLLREYAVKVR